jgi:V8-like Glu-specific endopeptidase
MFQVRILCVVFSLIASASAYAFPLPKHQLVERDFQNNIFATTYDFEGIVGLSNCSGSLVQLENSKDSDHAMVFTNGHCLELGFPEPGEVVTHKPSKRSMNLLTSQAQVAGKVTAEEIVFSTMTRTDLTIYRLKETYAEIKQKFNIRPLILAANHPESGSAIEVISGYWRKGYSCAIEAFIPQLKEGDWTFTDSMRYSRPGCETIGGTSGSPIVLAGSRNMIGINNTGNEDGENCTMNNPCEIDANGKVTAVLGYSYGQETFWVYSCLNQNNEIDLQVKGCKLPH